MVSANGPTVPAAASALRGPVYAHAASRAAPMRKPSRDSGTSPTRAHHIPRTVTPALANASRMVSSSSLAARASLVWADARIFVFGITLMAGAVPTFSAPGAACPAHLRRNRVKFRSRNIVSGAEPPRFGDSILLASSHNSVFLEVFCNRRYHDCTTKDYGIIPTPQLSAG